MADYHVPELIPSFLLLLCLIHMLLRAVFHLKVLGAVTAYHETREDRDQRGRHLGQD